MNLAIRQQLFCKTYLITVMLRLYIFLFCITKGLVWSQTSSLTRNTTLGQIRGLRESGVIQYLGVPYANPPIYENRFQPPLPKEPWNDILDATSHPPSCEQNIQNLRNILTTSSSTDDTLLLAQTSENCLYLNIYTAVNIIDETNLLPVMVFIHGGEFVRGTGSAYKGANLASECNVVVVTLNYRLGAFGFLFGRNDDIFGNLGLLDQKMAIRWITDNIQNFGGDPNLITVFGEEAGASSAHIHLLGDENRLFQNVIIQSAQYEDGMRTEKQCTDQYNNFLIELGYDGDTNVSESLLEETADAILTTSDAMEVWGPCAYSNILTDLPSALMLKDDYAKDHNVLIGTNSGAGQAYITDADVSAETWLYDITETIVTKTFPSLYGNITIDMIDDMSQNYLQFHAGYDFDESDDVQRLNFAVYAMGDQYHRTWAEEIARAVSEKSSSSVYKYLFTQAPISSLSAQTPGAPLSSELPYIFGYQQTSGVLPSPLIATMMTYWTNFAKTGNPNYALNSSETFLSWPPYIVNTTNSSQCRTVMELNTAGSSNMLTDTTLPRTWDFWTFYYEVLGLSCERNEEIVEIITEPFVEDCEPTVQEAIGMAVSNEEAGIMLIVFIVFTCVFLITTLIATFCCWSYKKKFKKEKEKNKNGRSGHDNPSTSLEYKL